jgi:DNA-nicking Smr family endonuclease
MTGNDDIDLWEAAMRDVKRLPKHTPVGKTGEKTAKRPTKKAPPAIRETVLLPKTRAKAVESQGKGLDKRTEQRLKRGQMDIEGTIDLHGLTQKQARDELVRTLSRFQKQGKRCILVITGQGRDKQIKNEDDWWESKPGLLRKRVPEWLTQKPLADIVLQFHIAKQQDGGLGALYVLLRRIRTT